MAFSLLLMMEFAFGIARRLVRDRYFRALGGALLTMVLLGTLFFWLFEGRPLLHALAYAALALAMSAPYATGWGPATAAGILFNVVYVFLGVGLFLLFVLEAGKTMVQSYQELEQRMADRQARRHARRRGSSPAVGP